MSPATILKELGLSPSEIAWATLQADTLYKADNEEIRNWNMYIDAMHQQGTDPLAWFLEKYQGLGLPDALKAVLLNKNPQREAEINAVRSINEAAAKELFHGTPPDNVRFWGPEGDPRQEPPPEEEAEEEEVEEIPFGPAVEGGGGGGEYADEPAIPAEEVERDAPEVLQPGAPEDHFAAPGHHEAEEEGVEDAEERNDLQRMLLDQHPQQAAVTWFIKNFGHVYNRLAHEKNIIPWDQSWAERIDDLYSLNEDTHDKLLKDTFKELARRIQQERFPGRKKTESHWVQNLEDQWTDVGSGEEYETGGNPNPFYGRLNTDEIEAAVREALTAAKVSGRSLAEHAVMARNSKGAINDLAQTLHHDMVAQNHLVGLDEAIQQAEASDGGHHGVACPDCKMGHHQLMYHHSADSQKAAGAWVGRNPRQKMGTGVMMPDFNSYYASDLRDALESIEGERPHPGRKKWSLARDLEHYYQNNLFPRDLKRKFDDPAGTGGFSGIRKPQTTQIGDIRKPTQEEIQATHGPSMYGGNIPVESSGFIFPGEFHPPPQTGAGGETLDMGGIGGGGQEEQLFSDDEWVKWLDQVNLANQTGSQAPVTTAQANMDMGFPHGLWDATQQMATQAQLTAAGGAENIPDPQALTSYQPLPPMQAEGSDVPTGPLSEDEVRAHEHMGRLNRITPLNWTGGPTKCVICAGHGKVSPKRAKMYARSSPRTGDDVAGMTDAELTEWMKDNYRIAGTQGSPRDISESNLDSFKAKYHIDFDPNDARHVQLMGGQIQSPEHQEIACPHCDAPHPLMDANHTCATGVCPTCTGDGRINHKHAEMAPLTTTIDRLTGDKERPLWLKPGPIGQQRIADAEYQKYLTEHQKGLAARRKLWKEKAEPHFQRYLDRDLLSSGDLAEMAPSIAREIRDEDGEIIQPQTEFKNKLENQHAIIERLLEWSHQNILGTIEQPTREEARAMARHMRGGIDEDVEAAGGLSALDPPEEARPPPEEEDLDFDFDMPSNRELSRAKRMADYENMESTVGTGRLHAHGPVMTRDDGSYKSQMYLTDLERLLQTGRATGHAPTGDAMFGETDLMGGISGESTYGPEGSGDRYANVINEMLKQRMKIMSREKPLSYSEKAKAARDFSQKCQDYLNNPLSPAENNPISFKEINNPNGTQETVLHWEPVTRMKKGAKGASKNYLSPFHKKMKMLEEENKGRLERHWKKKYLEQFGGAGLQMQDEHGIYDSSDADRAWKNRDEDGERQFFQSKDGRGLTYKEAQQSLMDQIKINTKHMDIHAYPSAGEGEEWTQQHKEWWLAQLRNLSKMADLTHKTEVREDGSQIPSWAEHMTRKWEDERDEHLLNHEPNRLWQAVLRAHGEDQSEETTAWLHDTLHDIWERHPGWMPYSLKDLEKLRSQSDDDEPVEKAMVALRISRFMERNLLPYHGP